MFIRSTDSNLKENKMACEIVELLERIHRLSGIALEFHGEYLGDVATDEVFGTAFELSMLEDDEEDLEEETFADSDE
jgi:hypothetical protein